MTSLNNFPSYTSMSDLDYNLLKNVAKIRIRKKKNIILKEALKMKDEAVQFELDFSFSKLKTENRPTKVCLFVKSYLFHRVIQHEYIYIK